jgi:hypothetical protein
MTQTLPKPIAEYIEATNTSDGDRLIAAFADDALVNDAPPGVLTLLTS